VLGERRFAGSAGREPQVRRLDRRLPEPLGRRCAPDRVEGLRPRSWLEYVDADQLCLASDCGFGRQGVPRPIALYKAAALAQGANVVRRELGAQEHEVPAAQRDRQVDPSQLEIAGIG
jgi:hypothetical protein